MNFKIKFIRETLSLSKKEISYFLNISSYKYSYYEKTAVDIPCEILLLLSKLYGISIRMFLDNNVSENNILTELKKQNFNLNSKSDIIKKMEFNLVNDSSIKITYHLINNIKEDFQQNIICSINTLLLKNKIDLNDFIESVGINKINLDSILFKKRFISIDELVRISEYFNISVEKIIYNCK